MSERKMFKIAGATLVVLLLLGFAGSTLHNAGWSQGYLMGLVASNNDGAAQMMPYALHGWHGFSPFGAVLGLFFKIGLFLFMFAIFAKFFRFWSWRMEGGPGGHWGERGHHKGHYYRERSREGHSHEERSHEERSRETYRSQPIQDAPQEKTTASGTSLSP